VISRVSGWTIDMVEGLTSEASLVLFVRVCSVYQLDSGVEVRGLTSDMVQSGGWLVAALVLSSGRYTTTTILCWWHVSCVSLGDDESLSV
jgi:hypothetical protein